MWSWCLLLLSFFFRVAIEAGVNLGDHRRVSLELASPTAIAARNGSSTTNEENVMKRRIHCG